MMDMLTDCAIFRPVGDESADLQFPVDKSANYFQLSGPPMFDLEPISASHTALLHPHLHPHPSSHNPPALLIKEKTPCEIAFVRSRMFYAKPALNARGGIRVGMRHIRQ